MIKVLLADDHTIIRDGLKVILEMQPEITVIGMATNGKDAVSQACELLPDVVVMDISMPEMNGIEATRAIHQLCPTVRVIILSMLITSEHVYKALQAGASGYLCKNAAGDEIVSAVLAVQAGKRYLSEPVTDIMVTGYIEKHTAEPEKSPLENLSQRECEILGFVVDGMSSAEIGKMLFLSTKTVETYRSRLMQKLGVKDAASLIKFAIQHNLTSTN